MGDVRAATETLQLSRPARRLQDMTAGGDMRRRRVKDLVVALAVAAVGCSGSRGSEPKNEQRGGARVSQERLTVTGCVLAAAGNKYELHQLAEVPVDQQVAPGSANSRPRLEAGSWARLSGGTDFKEYVGR